MRKKLLSAVLLFAVMLGGCSVYKSLVNLSNVKFRIKDVNEFEVLGIKISQKSGLDDLNFSDIAKLTQAKFSDSLPVSLTIDIEARNDSKGSYATSDLQIVRFPFTLKIDDKKIFEGKVNRRIKIPGKNTIVTFPVNVSFDVLKVFNELSADEIISLIFDLGGKNKNLDRIKIEAEPEIQLPEGFSFTKKVTITDQVFR